ncbi:transposase family protein, partial [Streptomyces sp. NPDC002285]
GTPLWFSRATPDPTHDLTPARAHHTTQTCLTHQILVLADRAYQSAAATVPTPCHHHREQPRQHHREQPRQHQQSNRNHTALRAPGEHTSAQLKTRRHLPQTRCSTRHISTTTQAAHTLPTCDHSG